MKRTEARMWEVLEEGTNETPGLRQVAQANNPNCSAEASLLVAIIVQAAAERDYKFFEDNRYRTYSELAGIDRHATLSIIEKIWEKIDG